MVDRKMLSEKELKAIAYFAVGVASEGSDREKDVAARLSFAGTIVDGVMSPKGNSGISIGTLQKDLGQDKCATSAALVEAYQAWANDSPESSPISETDVAASVAQLSRNGEAIRDHGGRDIDVTLRIGLNAFLGEKGGRDFVHARDVTQVERIHKRALIKMVESTVYKNASADAQIVLGTIVAKAFNQRETAGSALVEAMLVGKPRGKPLETLDDVLAYAEANHKKYLASGREHALTGAKVLARLHNADENSAIGRAWREVLADPLVRPTEVDADPDRPDLAAHYTLIKNMFHAPAKAMAFLDALEQARHHHEGKTTGTGFYTDGTNIVQWNANGKGVTFIDGQWAAVSRDDLVLTRQRDGTIEVARQVDGVAQPLLSVTAATPTVARALRPGANGEDVRQLQEDLSRLGYTDARGRPLHPDGDYGAGTQAAVLAFQREHGLAADGLCGQATRAGVQQAIASGEAAIGVAEAAYRQPTEAMATYRAFEPAPVPAEALLTPVVPPVAREQRPDAPTVNDAPTVEAVRTLQHNLNTLGMPDADGRPLATHGEFDAATREAVARFQSAHAMPITGQADEALHAVVRTEAFMAGLRREQPSVAPEPAPPAVAHPPTEPRPTAAALPDRPFPTAERATPSPVATTAPQRNDPRHPDHPNNVLYEALKGQLPDESERRLLQSTAACHRSGITAGNLSMVHINDDTMTLHFFGTGPLTSPAKVDLNRSSPPPEESIERMATFDHQQTQMLAEFRAQQAQMSQGRSL